MASSGISKGLSILVALALVLALAAMAVPMAGTVGAFVLPAEVWVNDDGASCPDTGSGTQADPYCMIQTGIDNVAPAGTVHVYPGTYVENLIINKSLTLQSVSGNWRDTMIDDIATAPEITISGDADVTVQGFEITAGSHGIYIGPVFSTVNILDCFIHDNAFDGIHVASSGDVLNIENNIISQNGLADASCGIHIEQAWTTVNIMDNIIGGWWGPAQPVYNGNDEDGIRVDDVPAGSYVAIEDNLIVANGDDGIDFPSVTSVDGNVNIEGNVIGPWTYGDVRFTGNGGHGIHVAHVSDTGRINIEGNALSENGEDGMNFGSGVSPIFGEVTILGNLIGAWTCYDGDYGYSGQPQLYRGNWDRGIEINQVGESGASGTVIIEGNKISENHMGAVDLTGIYIQTIYGVVTIEDNDVGSWTDRYGTSYPGNNGAGIVVVDVLLGAELTIGPDNSIKDNLGDGIEIQWGELDSSIKIHRNTIDNNDWNGVQLGTPCGLDGVIVHDIVGNNGSNGVERLLMCSEVDGATITHNTISNNNLGIYLAGPSDQNIVSDNEIRDNIDGIVVEGNENQILRNDILNNYGNEESGIHLVSYDGYPVYGNIIRCNNIVGNLPYGVSYEHGMTVVEPLGDGLYNQDGGQAIDATGNWWGCIEGPGAAGCDLVSGNVLYDPWLLDEFQNCRECVGAPTPPGVPTVSHIGIAAMIGLFAGLLVWSVRRRRLAS